jgi:hypothetical protein
MSGSIGASASIPRLRIPAVRHLNGLLILGIVAVPLSGCASQSTLAQWEAAGWRTGWVHQIVEGKNLRNTQELVCVSALSPDRIASSRFAVVWYSYPLGARRRQSLTVLVPDLLELKVGDMVQINILDCEKTISRKMD